MNTYTKICLVAGLCTTTYVILKFIKNSFGQEPAKKKSKKAEGEDKNITQTDSSVSDKKSVSFGEENSEESERRLLSDENSEENNETMKIARPKPNFFIAFQVFDKEIHENVKNFQEIMVAKNPLLYKALIPISTLHVTLAVTHLQNETDIKKLKLKLEEWASKNIMSLKKEPIVLTFNSISTFNDVVAYVNIDKCLSYRRLTQLSQAMEDVISSAGFTNDSKKFTPHLTVVKLSRDFNLLKAKKDFKKDFGIMKECRHYFGMQEVKHIQLLSMTEPKDKNGYYKCYHQINISDIKDEIDHSECCAPIPEPIKKLK